VHLGEEGDVLVDRQVAIQAESLRQIADAFREGAMRAHRIEAKHPQLALVCVQ
jgi:hypothetical protein